MVGRLLAPFLSFARLAVSLRHRVTRWFGKKFKSRVLPFWRAALRPRFTPDASSDVVVSFTSFPARTGAVWAVVDTLFLQDARIREIVLVLSEKEFPERQLPRTLKRRIARGLTIKWIGTDRRSFDKLLPALKSFPLDRIITVDDDKLYSPSMASALVRASHDAPGAIIGHRGRSGRLEAGRFRPCGRAGPHTVSGSFILAGGNGVLYPPAALHPDVSDFELASMLCPTHDDVWFWAMALRAGTEVRCLGTAEKPTRLAAQDGTPALSSMNDAGSENSQIDAVVDHFALVPLLSAVAQSHRAVRDV
jgi:hypothetical protein